MRDFRRLNAVGAGACLFGLAFAYFWLERGLGLEPCPLCMFDRYLMAGAAVVFALAAVHGPRRSGPRRVYAGVALVFLLGGVGIGARHVWLQQLPADEVPACGPSLDYLLDVFPLSEAVQMVLQGSGSCAQVDAAFLGVTLAQWTLVVFVGLAALAGWLLVRPGRG